MKTFIVDDMNPEDVAMLQALYSRSSSSVETHLDRVKQGGSSKFMERYVVSYGHKSIADCGATTMFIEGVSLLAAKAIQDNPLYSGQETSTRYIDMSRQPIIDPLNTPASREIMERWMSFYTESQERVAALVRKKHPRRDVDDEKTYESAVKARTFDIMRGFLPAGICTQLSWHTNLRQATDNLVRLRSHPLVEVNEIGDALAAQLHERYPASGFDRYVASVSGTADREDDDGREAWERAAGRLAAYTPGTTLCDDDPSCVITPMTDYRMFERFKSLLSDRPRGVRLPHALSNLAQVRSCFTLDFGSFRDVQRHRAGICLMPLLDLFYGFESWYLDQLSDLDDMSLYKQASRLLDEQASRIRGLQATAEERQYFVALGYKVATDLNYSLPAMIYLAEMRSAKTVHPTLRRRVRALGTQLKKQLPGVALHIDRSDDDWTLRRGTQTITER